MWLHVVAGLAAGGIELNDELISVVVLGVGFDFLEVLEGLHLGDVVLVLVQLLWSLLLLSPPATAPEFEPAPEKLGKYILRRSSTLGGLAGACGVLAELVVVLSLLRVGEGLEGGRRWGEGLVVDGGEGQVFL